MSTSPVDILGGDKKSLHGSSVRAKMQAVSKPLDTSAFRMASQLLGGPEALKDRLNKYRTAGVSYEAIGRLLEPEGVHVSPETLRRWGKQLRVDGAASKGAA